MVVVAGPRSTPFFNDSCSDTETVTGEDGIIQTSNDRHFISIKEERENDNPFFKANNNLPLHTFTGKQQLNRRINTQKLSLGVDITKRRDDHFMGIAFPSALDSGQSQFFLNPPVAHQNPPQTAPGLNPIDRLYSMQNSYFCGEEQMEQ